MLGSEDRNGNVRSSLHTILSSTKLPATSQRLKIPIFLTFLIIDNCDIPSPIGLRNFPRLNPFQSITSEKLTIIYGSLKNFT